MPNDTGDWYDNYLARLLGLPCPGGATGPGRSDWLSQLAASISLGLLERQRREADANFSDVLKACVAAAYAEEQANLGVTPVVKLPPLSAPWVTPADADSPPVPPRRATDDDEFLRELGISLSTP